LKNEVVPDEEANKVNKGTKCYWDANFKPDEATRTERKSGG